MLGGLDRGWVGKGVGNCVFTADCVRGLDRGGKGREWGIVC